MNYSQTSRYDQVSSDAACVGSEVRRQHDAEIQRPVKIADLTRIGPVTRVSDLGPDLDRAFEKLRQGSYEKQ